MAVETLKIQPRSTWNARPPLKTEKMDHPIEVVQFCYTHPRNILDIETIKDVQHLHMDFEKMDDIKNNFIIGRDGTVYEGRGWHNRPPAAMFEDFDNNLLDILIITSLTGGKPDPIIYKAINSLMAVGKQLNYMKEQYMVIGQTKYGAESGKKSISKQAVKI